MNNENMKATEEIDSLKTEETAMVNSNISISSGGVAPNFSAAVQRAAQSHDLSNILSAKTDSDYLKATMTLAENVRENPEFAPIADKYLEQINKFSIRAFWKSFTNKFFAVLGIGFAVGGAYIVTKQQPNQIQYSSWGADDEDGSTGEDAEDKKTA